MEKEDPDNFEFVVPAKLKELYNNKDFGRYAMKMEKCLSALPQPPIIREVTPVHRSSTVKAN